MHWKTGNDGGRITATNITYNEETRDETNLGQFSAPTIRQSLDKSAPFSLTDAKTTFLFHFYRKFEHRLH